VLAVLANLNCGVYDSHPNIFAKTQMKFFLDILRHISVKIIVGLSLVLRSQTHFMDVNVLSP